MGTKEQGENMEREQLLAVLGETPETLDRAIENIKIFRKQREDREKQAKTQPKNFPR